MYKETYRTFNEYKQLLTDASTVRCDTLTYIYIYIKYDVEVNAISNTIYPPRKVKVFELFLFVTTYKHIIFFKNMTLFNN